MTALNFFVYAVPSTMCLQNFGFPLCFQFRFRGLSEKGIKCAIFVSLSSNPNRREWRLREKNGEGSDFLQNQGIWRNRLCCSGLCAKSCRMAFECNTVVLQTSLGCTSNKPCLHFRQALPAMRNACVLSGKRQKNAGKACPLYIIRC